MLYPIAIETGNEEHSFGVVFPDLPGCFSAGNTLEEALANAKEAAHLYIEDLADQDKLPPQAGSLSNWMENTEYQGWSWAVIDIDVEPYMGKSSKINVSLPNLLTKKIDNMVEMDPAYKSRSHFLQVAAIHELQLKAR